MALREKKEMAEEKEHKCKWEPLRDILNTFLIFK